MQRVEAPPAILTSLPPAERYRLIGEIVTLMTQSPVHKVYRVEDLPLTILIPIELNQFRIYRNSKGEPMALVTWGMFSKEAEATFLRQTTLLTKGDWRSGDIIYFTDFIVPYGQVKQIVKDLRERFRGKTTYSIHYDAPNQQRPRIRQFTGYRDKGI